MDIHEVIWEKPEQLTMANALTEELMASLTSGKQSLQIRYLQQRLRVDHRRPTLTMGRGRDNRLIVDDPLVSRMHGRIELKRNRFMLTDQSTNGTFLRPNGIEPIFLHRDAVVLKGEGVIRLGQRVDPADPMGVFYSLR